MPNASINFDFGKMAKASHKFITELINDAADVQVQAWHDQFARGKGADGKAWTKIKPATAKRKGNTRPLVDTRELDNGFHVSKRATVGKKQATLVPSKKRRAVAAAHNEGNKNLPQRKLIPDKGFYPSSQAKIDRLIRNTELKIGRSIKITRINIT